MRERVGFLSETVALLIVGCCLAAKMFELEAERVELIVIDVACSKLVGVTSNEKVYIPRQNSIRLLGSV